MVLDIRGSLKNTKLSSNVYVVFEELISNAIDSFLIRKHDDQSVSDLDIKIDITFSQKDLLEELEDISICCTDNGCGLAKDQLNAFLTKDTSYKDDLSIHGISKCRGVGRIQFFHHFSEISIKSTYKNGNGLMKCSAHYREPKKELDHDDFIIIPDVDGSFGTTICLVDLKDLIRSRITHVKKLSDCYSSPLLKKQMLVAFLQRLVSLKDSLGDFKIKFSTSHWKNGKDSRLICRSDLPDITTERKVNVREVEPNTGDDLGTYQIFTISHYKIDSKQYDLPKNAIALCAKSSPVKDITSRYLKTKTELNNPVGGFNHIILIESEYLDQQVNEQRDGFENIPNEIPNSNLFSDEKISYELLYEAIDPVIGELVAPTDWKKETIVNEVVDKFGISEAMLHDTSTRIVYGDSAQDVAGRVLKKYQDRVIDETAAIFSLKEEIIKSEPDSDDFRAKINELSWRYTSSLKNFDMANLSQLIVRRAAIVQILDLAYGKQLAMQAIDVGARRKDERIIHSVFFPMRKDSNEVSDHDIWLLSEEYHYYDYIASDMPLSKITWDGGEKIFDDDIDGEFLKLLQNRSNENSNKRPDIALFTKEGSAIIIEFKAPNVSLDEHIGDLSEYAHLLAAKSRGKLRKFYGYLIGDTINPLRLGTSWTSFPTGKGVIPTTVQPGIK